MSDQAQTTPKHPRRSRRNHKTPGASSSTQPPSDTQTNGILDSASSSTQATISSHQNDQAIDMAKWEDLNSKNLTPATPPRTYSTEPSSTKRDKTRSEPVQVSTKKKDGNKTQNNRQKAQQRPSQSGTPSQTVRPQTLNAGYVSETPSKAYAGPTFHASPAASSLPMPKFFSKSVPNVDKTTSLKNMMEPDAPEVVSTDEESPSSGHAKLEGDRQAREESPLDIFFQADRQAKGRANANSTSHLNGNFRGLSPFDSLRPDASPPRLTPRHHSRHPTDSSSGGVFNLEMGSPPAQEHAPLSSKTPQPAYNRSVSASSAEKTDDQIREERRQESTLALKRMLLVPGAHRSEVANPDVRPEIGNLGSPSPKDRQSRKSPTRNPSGNASPAPALVSESTRMQREAALRALAQKKIPTSNTYMSQNARTPTIRKEMASPSPSNDFDTERTPKPANLGDSPPSAHTRSQTKNRQTPLEGNGFPIHGLRNLTINSNPQHKVTPSGHSPTTVAIENDLRRILKMDLLGSDGASGVQS